MPIHTQSIGINLNTPLIKEKNRETFINGEFSEEIINFTNLSQEFVQPSLKFFSEPIERYSEEKIYFKDYNFEELHELDYKILKAQIKNQLGILGEINSHNRNITSINSKIYDLEQKTKFMRENADFLYNGLYLKYLNKEIETKSALIFKNKDVYSYIDDKGIPKLRYNNSLDSISILILSSGEKNKLFLAILGTLLSISNRNQFMLIDEPNELLDYENINIMKEFFSSLFRNKQILICTHVEKYKDFQPALIKHIWKNKNNNSVIDNL